MLLNGIKMCCGQKSFDLNFVDQIFEDADRNKNGLIDFTEFLEWALRIPNTSTKNSF